MVALDIGSRDEEGVAEHASHGSRRRGRSFRAAITCLSGTRAFGVGFLSGLMVEDAAPWVSALFLLASATAVQADPAYAWVNFVGQPGGAGNMDGHRQCGVV